MLAPAAAEAEAVELVTSASFIRLELFFLGRWRFFFGFGLDVLGGGMLDSILDICNMREESIRVGLCVGLGMLMHVL